MAIRDLVTRSRAKSESLSKRSEDPFGSLHQQIDQAFENFGRGLLDSPLSAGFLDSGSAAGYGVRVDVKEGEKDVEITAELPGVEEKDVELSLSDNQLTIRGEKRAEKEEKGRDWYRMERSYGSFHRTVPLPGHLDHTKADATFKKGLLRVVVPKRNGSKREANKIAIRRG